MSSFVFVSRVFGAVAAVDCALSQQHGATRQEASRRSRSLYTCGVGRRQFTEEMLCECTINSAVQRRNAKSKSCAVVQGS
jgi:hypothetical protein